MGRITFFFGVAFGLTLAGSAAAQYAPLPPPPAPAAAPPGYYPPPMPARQRFGDQNQLVVSGDTNFALTGTSYSNNGGSSFNLTLQPSLDYFVIQNFSVGVLVTIDHTSSNNNGASTSLNTYGVAGRVGYNLALGDTFSIWPKVALGFDGTSGSATPAGAGAKTDDSGNALYLQVFVPVLVHPINHFFFGLGPFIKTDLSASASANGTSIPGPPKATTYGLLFDLGGWMDF